MKKIQITCLNNPATVNEIEQLLVFGARLTQKGNVISGIEDAVNLYDKPHTQKTLDAMMRLPHQTIRQFGMISVVVTGASRRFLAQVTRRRVGVTFMSGSLQYSDFSNAAEDQFVVPYELYANPRGQEAIDEYLESCARSMDTYRELISLGCPTDAAGYAPSMSLRNVLLISASPQAWIELISQRICRRNSAEIRYVMLRIWALLQQYDMFKGADIIGCDCMKLDGRGCSEGRMSCKRSMHLLEQPTQILMNDFPLIYSDTVN